MNDLVPNLLKNVLQIILRHRGALQLCSLYMLRLQHHLFQSKIGDESQSHSRDASHAKPP